MADPRSHARHDRFAVAAAVGGGSLPATVATCPACGSLFEDLVALRRAIQGAWTPRRARAHQLSAADGARLRRHGWRTVLGLIGTRRDTVTRPLATVFTALGIVGVLLTAAPTFMLGSAAAEGSGDTGIMAAPFPAAAPSAGASIDPDHVAGETPIDLTRIAPPARPPSLPDRSSGTILLSVGFLTLGLGLFGMRRSAGRRRVR